MEKPASHYGAEIRSMASMDQKMRSSGQPSGTLDRQNTERMRGIIEEIGWPTRSKVGSDASSATWLLVQHADHDVSFQEYCLSLMKEESKSDVPLSDVAYLEDRIAVGRGKHQLYGTQFFINSKGDFGPRPIKDKDTLDQRREAMGLDSFDAYKKDMELIFRAKQKKQK